MALELHPENNLNISNNLSAGGNVSVVGSISAEGDINTNSRFLSSGQDIGLFFVDLSTNKLDKWLSAGHVFIGNSSDIATAGKISDEHVSNTAYIAGTKIVSDFGTQNVSTDGAYLSSGTDLLDIFVGNSLQQGKMWVGNSLNKAQQYTITGDVSVGNGGVTSILDGKIFDKHVALGASISGIKIKPNFFQTVNVFNGGLNAQGNINAINLQANGVYVDGHWSEGNWIPAHWEQGNVIARQDISAGEDALVGANVIAQGDVQTFGRFMSGNDELSTVLANNGFLTKSGLTNKQIYIGQPSTGAQAKTVYGEVLLNSTGETTIASGAIKDIHVSSTAGISGTKIIPSFGNQTIYTNQGADVAGPILSGGKELLSLTLDCTNTLYLQLTGGTINGPLTIQGGNLTMGPGTHLLSGGLDLSEVLSSVINGAYLPTGGGTITGGLVVDQDLTVRGNFNILGNISQVDTEVSITSALSINNSGLGLALNVSQTGSGNVAKFSDENGSILSINENGKVGIKNDNPVCELDVNGSGKFVSLSTQDLFASLISTSTLSANQLYGNYVHALSGFTAYNNATVWKDLIVGRDEYIGRNSFITGRSNIDGGLTVGVIGRPDALGGTITTSKYISAGTWLTVGSSASSDVAGSIVADSFGKFGDYLSVGKWLTVNNNITANGDIRTNSRFLSGSKDLTVVMKEVGDGLYFPLTGYKSISGDIDITSGGKYLSGGVDLRNLFSGTLPSLKDKQTFIGSGGAGIVTASYLTGGDVFLASNTGALNISAGKVTTAHISAGSIVDSLVSSNLTDRISGTKILANFGSQDIDTTGSYKLSGMPLTQYLAGKFLPLSGGTVTGPLSVVSTITNRPTLIVNDNGNVAIGSNLTSTYKLQVSGAAFADSLAGQLLDIRDNGVSTSALFASGNKVGINTREPNVELAVAGSISATNTLISDKILTNALTATTIGSTTVNTTTLTASNIIAEQGVFSKFFAADVSSNPLILTNSDSGKIFHVNTNTTDITAAFLDNLFVGFNVGLMNVGTGTIYISSSQPGFINAFLGVNTNKTLNTGMFVYKHNDNQLYGVGMFNP